MKSKLLGFVVILGCIFPPLAIFVGSVAVVVAFVGLLLVSIFDPKSVPVSEDFKYHSNQVDNS